MSQTFQPAPDGTVEIDIRLQVGGTISGRVNDRSESGATAIVCLLTGGGPPQMRHGEAFQENSHVFGKYWQTVEPDGTYRISAIRPGRDKYQLFVLKNGTVYDHVPDLEIKNGETYTHNLTIEP
jgi:hypothetical protein